MNMEPGVWLWLVDHFGTYGATFMLIYFAAAAALAPTFYSWLKAEREDQRLWMEMLHKKRSSFLSDLVPRTLSEHRKSRSWLAH